jgi:K+-sensing histidine kinase KdpD
LEGIADDLQIWHTFIHELSDAVRQLLNKDSRDQKIRQAVKEAVDVIANAFTTYRERNKIEIINDIPATINTPPMFLAQLYSIITNLLTNSMKWVMFQEDRRIRFEGDVKNNVIEIRVLDSGPGVAKDIREKVFEPFVSYSSPNLELGTGTGLGLTIVRNFVSDANGTVEFVDPPKKWGACCVIRFEDE